jgi:hypothetical protein
MKLKEVIEKDCGIVVNNKEEYDRLAKILDEAGLRWRDGESYVGYSNFSHDFPFYIRVYIGTHGRKNFTNRTTIPLSDLEEAQDQTELERLRRENAELKAQLSQQQPKAEWPKELDECWISTMDGGVDMVCFNYTNNEHIKLLSIGNIHRTREAAEAWFERKQLEHKMNEGGKVQVYLSTTFNDWLIFSGNKNPRLGSFSSKESAQDFLSDPENIKLLDKHFK